MSHPPLRAGFTLVELLLVVLILGLVAALVLPRFSEVKQKAYIAAMQSDLHAMATAQELYADDRGTYAPATPLLPSFTTSDGVDIQMAAVTPSTYTAIATHDRSPTICTLAAGPDVVSRVACRASRVAVVQMEWSLVCLGYQSHTFLMRATPFDRNNQVVPGLPVVWTSSVSSVASVSPQGFVTGLTSGRTVVTAHIDGTRGDTRFLLDMDPAHTSIACN